LIGESAQTDSNLYLKKCPCGLGHISLSSITILTRQSQEHFQSVTAACKDKGTYSFR
jgi:hypothetical protein